MNDNDPLILLLPFPPTVNSYYTSVGRTPGRRVSMRGKRFTEEVARDVGEQLPLLGCPLDYRLNVEVVLYPPDRRTRDLDNYMKALLDALTKARVWEDDCLIDQLSILRGAVMSGGVTKIEIGPAGPLIPPHHKMA